MLCVEEIQNVFANAYKTTVFYMLWYLLFTLELLEMGSYLYYCNKNIK